MFKYLLKRIGYMIIVFFLNTIIIFAVYKAMPADPVTIYMEGDATGISPQRYALMREQITQKLGLDRPIYIQYVRWVRDLLTGDFGYSMQYKMPVKQVLGTPIKNTVQLNIINLILVFAITIPIAIRSAVRRGKLFDNVTQVVTILGYSLPTFITAILAMLVFSINLKWLPMTGTSTPAFKGDWFASILDRAKYMILPLLVMTFTSLGGLTRYVRAAMIEALNMDCIRTARAKGLRDKVVIYSHAMRNAQITVITVMANWFLGIFGGSLVIEKIFNWKGMGITLYEAVMQMDFGLAFAMNLFYVVISLVGHLAVDIIYAAADPRIRLT